MKDIKHDLYKATPAWIKTASTAELIELGKRAVRFTNRRIAALEKAGLKNRYTTAGVRKRSTRTMTLAEKHARESAIRAIQGARHMLNTKISTVSGAKKAIKKAVGQVSKRGSAYGGSGRRGIGISKKEQQKVLIRVGKDAKKVADYWKMQEELFIPSDEAYRLWDDLQYDDNPAESLKKKKEEYDKKEKELNQELINKMRGASNAFKFPGQS